MYLDGLDDLLRAGATALSGELRERQRRYVLERQHPDGGWGGRLGGSDLYYTDFALRILGIFNRTDAADEVCAEAGARTEADAHILEAMAGALSRAERFVAAWRREPRDVVEWFNALNAERMLWSINRGIGTGIGSSGRAGIDYEHENQSQISDLKFQIDENPQSAIQVRRPSEPSRPQSRFRLKAGHPNFNAWRGAAGGFSRSGGGGSASAYATFLAALALEMLEAEFPEPEHAIQEIRKLKRPDGGYADLASGAAGQTNATAAAVAFLVLRGALTAPDPATVDFLLAMQAADGGFKACVDAPESDLLSTFTALVSLFALDAMRRVNLGAAVRWISGLAGEEGGFRAAASDMETDIEYTYYGVGALALVRAYVGIVKGLT